MLSFKQYLCEEPAHYENPILIITMVAQKNSDLFNLLKKISDKLLNPSASDKKQLGGIIHTGVNVGSTHLNIKITLSAIPWSKEKLQTVKDFYINKVVKLSKGELEYEEQNSYIALYGTLDPNCTLDAPKFGAIYSNAKNVSLIGLSSQLNNDCEFELSFPENVSAGGLCLLKFKNLKLRNVWNVPQPKWLQIIEAHHKGDKNIAACQTELMKNGFKQHAKL